jgi:PKD repeat protein
MYSNPGNKTVSLTIDQGITQTKADYISVSPDAIAGFTWTQVSREITFTNTSEYAESYLWYFGDGSSSDETNPVHLYAEDGVFTVSLFANSAECAGNIISEDIEINTVGISHPDTPLNIAVYPNPGNGVFYFCPAAGLQHVAVKMIDVTGQVVHRENFSSVASGTTVKFGNLQLNPGIYFVEINSNEGEMLTKVLVK